MRRNYKFTEKKQSGRGMLAFALSLLSAAILVAVILISFSARGEGSLYLGSAGVSSMVLSVLSFVLALAGLREEKSFKLFPCLALAASLLTGGLWGALYVVGFVL